MARRMTFAEVMQPIEGVTCARCKRDEAVIYPTVGNGVLICPTCSFPKETDDE